MLKEYLKFFFLLSVTMHASEGSETDMDRLLESYRIKSDFSQITKSESAGFVDVFTRVDIERMQARTLADIVKLFTVPYISRSRINTSMYVKPSQKNVPASAVRIFINEHDITATTYQSGALICNSITLDGIDHIEVYRSSASVEFGNEPGTIIIKLYTKTPYREEGGKVRFSADQSGSHYLSGYIGRTLEKDMSYFAYGNVNRVKRDTYYHRGASLDSNSMNGTLYANMQYKDWLFEVGHLQSSADAFLGMGSSVTPDGGEVSQRSSYLHITKKFQNGIRVQGALDYIETNEEMYDPGGIPAGEMGRVQYLRLNSTEKIYSLIADKHFKSKRNDLFIGAFIKHKHAEVDNRYGLQDSRYIVHYNMYSLYVEDKYSFDETTMGILSFKADRYQYTQDIEDQTGYIFRAGVIKNIDAFQIKAFYTRTYYNTPLIALYSDGTNAPYKTNLTLKFAEPTLYSLGIRYKTPKHLLNLRTSYIELKDPIKYDPNRGFVNGNNTSYIQYEASYTYQYDINTRFSVDFYAGKREDGMEYSAPYGGHIVFYNAYGKFDFFNMLDIRSGYSDYGVEVSTSYDWTSSIRYHYSKDLMIGIKGENLLNKGYKQVYQGLDYAIPVFDRKVWLNVEYVF